MTAIYYRGRHCGLRNRVSSVRVAIEVCITNQKPNENTHGKQKKNRTKKLSSIVFLHQFANIAIFTVPNLNADLPLPSTDKGSVETAIRYSNVAENVWILSF